MISSCWATRHFHEWIEVMRLTSAHSEAVEKLFFTKLAKITLHHDAI